MPGTSSPSSALLFIPLAFGSIPPHRAMVWVHPAGYTWCPALRSMKELKKNRSIAPLVASTRALEDLRITWERPKMNRERKTGKGRTKHNMENNGGQRREQWCSKSGVLLVGASSPRGSGANSLVFFFSFLICLQGFFGDFRTLHGQRDLGRAGSDPRRAGSSPGPATASAWCTRQNSGNGSQTKPS